MTAILPGSTIGILGGGQLGRMMAMAARSLGYRVKVMDPDPSCPARFVVDAYCQGGWGDAPSAAELARGSDVVTLEIEQIERASLEAAARYALVRPGIDLMMIVQDRILQRNWLRGRDVPMGQYLTAFSRAEVLEAIERLGPQCFIKSARGGYDGRSQLKLGFDEDQDVESAWRFLGSRPCVVEKALSLQAEISVMVARSPSGEIKCFPSARNYHENQILAWSVLPSSSSAELECRAQRIATFIANELELEGLLAVEMFVTDDGTLLVNELAPRPHNSYHASERACDTSQFEQAIRAICDLPLGDVSVIRPAAIANLLGELWENQVPSFDKALAVPGVHLHLYEKQFARPGRKMGHLSATGDTAEQAVDRVLQALQALKS